MKNKSLLLLLGLALSLSSSFAQSKADTIAIDQSSITKWITDSTTTAKGRLSVKYYCLYNKQLVPTNKTTLQNVLLCKKHKAECALILITSRTGRKRIVCN